VLGIALTGLAIGGAWLAVAITAAVAIGRAIHLADQDARARPDPEVVVDTDAGPLLGVVQPRAPSWTS
jgi:hypothetical protein